MTEPRDRGVRDIPLSRGMAERRLKLRKHSENKNRNKSAKPRWPLERSIPEFPTKVGGHHVTKSTDLARDSSLKDR